MNVLSNSGNMFPFFLSNNFVVTYPSYQPWQTFLPCDYRQHFWLQQNELCELAKLAAHKRFHFRAPCCRYRSNCIMKLWAAGCRSDSIFRRTEVFPLLSRCAVEAFAAYASNSFHSSALSSSRASPNNGQPLEQYGRLNQFGMRSQ